MNNNNVLRLLDGINQEEVNSFIANTKSSLNIKKITNRKTVDYTWVNVIYEFIPYIDNIIDSHRSFTKDDFLNSNKLFYINEVDENDVYENRFVFTLINRLKEFVSKNIEEISEEKIKNEVVYDATSKYNGKNVKINVLLETVESNSINQKDEISNYKERIDVITLSLNKYLNSEYIKRLSDVIEVKSPIRKTNVILKDKNLRKALELWEYLDNYEINEPSIVSTDIKESKNARLCNKYTLTYYLNLFNFNNIDIGDKKESEELLKLYMSKLIYDYVDDTNVSEKQFKSFVSREFKEAKKNKVRRENNIYECFKNFKNRHDNKLKEAFLNIQSDFKVDKENYML